MELKNLTPYLQNPMLGARWDGTEANAQEIIDWARSTEWGDLIISRAYVNPDDSKTVAPVITFRDADYISVDELFCFEGDWVLFSPNRQMNKLFMRADAGMTDTYPEMENV